MEKNNSYYLKNRERILANYQLKKEERKQYYETNKEKILNRQRKYFSEYYHKKMMDIHYRYDRYHTSRLNYVKRVNPGVLDEPVPLPKNNLVKFGF